MTEILQRDQDEKIGIYFLDGDTCIGIDSPLWDMSPSEVADEFIRLRSDAILARSAAVVKWVLMNADSMREMVAVNPRRIIRRRERISFVNADGNPFLSESEKYICRISLVMLREWVCRRISQRGKIKQQPNQRWGAKRQAVDRDGGKCRYCGIEVGINFHLDHVKPRAYGGQTTLDNLVVACAPCNLKKSGRTPVEAGMTLLPL